MKKNIYLFLIIAATYLVQSTFHLIVPASVSTPNFLIILIVSMGAMRGKKSGMWIGFVSGLITDLLYGDIFCFTALIYMYIGYFNGFLFKVFFDGDIRIPIITSGVSDLLYGLLVFAVNFALRDSGNFRTYFMNIILPETVGTMLCSIPFYGIYYWLNKRIVAGELEEKQSPWLRR